MLSDDTPPAAPSAPDVGTPGGTTAAGTTDDMQDHDAAPPGTARYCTVCLLWLNGPKQLESHQIGRDHRRVDQLGGKVGPLPRHAPAREDGNRPVADEGEAVVVGGAAAADAPGRQWQ